MATNSILLKACRKCRAIQADKKNPRCANCNSTDLTPDFTGLVYIINPKESKIAEKLVIDIPGNYALKVR